MSYKVAKIMNDENSQRIIVTWLDCPEIGSKNNPFYSDVKLAGKRVAEHYLLKNKTSKKSPGVEIEFPTLRKEVLDEGSVNSNLIMPLDNEECLEFHKSFYKTIYENIEKIIG